MGSTSRPRMRVLVIFCALVSIAMAGKGKDFMQMMGEAEGKMPDMMGKPSGGMMGKPDAEKPSKGEKDGLCLSNDQVHMMCGIGTKLQEMMAAAMDDMQDMSMESDIKLLSSGRAFDFDEPSERKQGGRRRQRNRKDFDKPSERRRRRKTKKPKESKKPNKKPSKKQKKQNKSKKNKKPSKPSDFKSCEASCPSLDEMRSSAMEEM